MNASRRGVILLEVVVAFGLMAVLVTICLQMLAVNAAARRAVERRAVALQEAANMLERVSALSWEQITAQRVAEFELSPSVRDILPGATARLSVEASGDAGPPAKQVRVEISWTNSVGETEAPVQLSSWTYARGKEPKS